jgi:hypothetical protein
MMSVRINGQTAWVFDETSIAAAPSAAALNHRNLAY